MQYTTKYGYPGAQIMDLPMCLPVNEGLGAVTYKDFCFVWRFHGLDTWFPCKAILWRMVSLKEASKTSVIGSGDPLDKFTRMTPLFYFWPAALPLYMRLYAFRRTFSIKRWIIDTALSKIPLAWAKTLLIFILNAERAWWAAILLKGNLPWLCAF